MTEHKPAIFAAFAGFAFTALLQLPPILDARAMATQNEAIAASERDAEVVELGADTTARFNQLLRQ